MSHIRLFIFLVSGLGWKGETMTVIDGLTREERKTLRGAGAILSLRCRLVPGGYERKMALRTGVRLTQHSNERWQLRNKQSHRSWIPAALVIKPASLTDQVA